MGDLFLSSVETTDAAEADADRVELPQPADPPTEGSRYAKHPAAGAARGQRHGAAPHHRHGEGEEGPGARGGDHRDEETGRKDGVKILSSVALKKN